VASQQSIHLESVRSYINIVSVNIYFIKGIMGGLVTIGIALSIGLVVVGISGVAQEIFRHHLQLQSKEPTQVRII